MKARATAFDILQNDPSLQTVENKNIHNAYQELNKNGEVWSNIS